MLNYVQMFLDAVPFGLCWLLSNVANVDLERRRVGQSVLDTGNKQIGHEAGEETAWANHDHVGIFDGPYRLRMGDRVSGNQGQ